ncbi:MAG: PEP-CTERM sorting domain-containing protein [Oxalobacteraceae bacterium]|nr:MAG: PEP-CTERM sorting domain-containing protein [Oxalobacteraceae bacterium]
MRNLFAIALLAATTAQAADLSFSGNAVNHNDKIVIDFQVAAGSTVSLWTDSWQSGLNFDPQLFLASGGVILNADGNGGSLDDDGGSLVDPAAGYYDAGLKFMATTAGSYRLVLNAASNNALGASLSQGFVYDGDTPIKLADWNQPSYDLNANDQKGGFWRLHLSGVEQAAMVPEPSSIALLLAGVLSIALAVRRQQRTR